MPVAQATDAAVVSNANMGRKTKTMRDCTRVSEAHATDAAVVGN